MEQNLYMKHFWMSIFFILSLVKTVACVEFLEATWREAEEYSGRAGHQLPANAGGEVDDWCGQQHWPHPVWNFG